MKRYSGDIGSQRDVEYVPRIRKDFRKAKIAMDLAGRFDKKGITSASEIGEVEDADTSTAADPTAPDVAREKKSSLNCLRNKILVVSAVTKAKEQESGEIDDESVASADKIDQRISMAENTYFTARRSGKSEDGNEKGVARK